MFLPGSYGSTFGRDNFEQVTLAPHVNDYHKGSHDLSHVTGEVSVITTKALERTVSQKERHTS
eukprot:m.287618 g.287618  ORF g.287618 m.287618 type:complete len:63 (+) comp19951_c0_seq2:476-664(+)